MTTPGTWQVGNLLSVTADFFSKRGIESARLDAEVLLADTLDLTRELLIARREQRLTDIELSAFRERVRQRAGQRPVAYLVNRKEFFSLPFYVDESVLIPRPETELLVELILRRLKSQIQICDVGTGSGCIAAAVASSRPDCSVLATEISENAAKVAVKNMSDLGLLSNVRVCRCDLFPVHTSEPFDVIVSNPPYLSLEEYHALPPGIRKFEPKGALTDEKDGLTMYRRIFRSAASRIKPDGVLFLEVSPRIADLFRTRSFLADFSFVLTDIHKDLAGLPRVAEFHIPSKI